MKRTTMRPLPNISCLKIDTSKNNIVSHVNENNLIRLAFYKEPKYMPRIDMQSLKP